MADVAIGVQHARLMQQKLPNCKGLVEVEGAAHAPNLTHSEVVNGPLIEFLRAYA
jgi:pimeloyl-ACP methyl ester carboxylesterase